MSRFDHVFARRSEAKRPKRRSQKLHPRLDPITRKVDMVNLGRHKQGDQWWRANAAELAERNLKAGAS